MKRAVNLGEYSLSESRIHDFEYDSASRARHSSRFSQSSSVSDGRFRKGEERSQTTGVLGPYLCTLGWQHFKEGM